MGVGKIAGGACVAPAIVEFVASELEKTAKVHKQSWKAWEDKALLQYPTSGTDGPHGGRMRFLGHPCRRAFVTSARKQLSGATPRLACAVGLRRQLRHDRHQRPRQGSRTRCIERSHALGLKTRELSLDSGNFELLVLSFSITGLLEPKVRRQWKFWQAFRELLTIGHASSRDLRRCWALHVAGHG